MASGDPAKSLLELLDQNTDAHERWAIMHALVRHADKRVIQRFFQIAKTSGSADERRNAIDQLANIGNRESLLALAALLDATYPEELRFQPSKTSYSAPSIFFPSHINDKLSRHTGQDFRQDRTRWENWINSNFN